MSDYIGQIARLQDWNVLDIQNHTALTVGMLRSAGASIGRLLTEVDRLSLENIGLKKQLEQQTRMPENYIELPPIRVGDVAWGFGGPIQKPYPRCGKVNSLEIDGNRVLVSIKSVCRGVYGETIFSTKDDAAAALQNKQGGVTTRAEP